MIFSEKIVCEDARGVSYGDLTYPCPRVVSVTAYMYINARTSQHTGK